MSKKLVVIVIIVALCALICFLGYKNINFKIETKGGLKTNGLSYALGNNNGKSEFTYSIKLTNTNGKTIETSVNETIKNKILSKENVKPNETIQVDEEIIVDTKGLFKQDIEKLITDIKVSTEETVSLK